MLYKIRKTTDSTIFRIFLIIVAIAFAWSYRDFIGGAGNRIIVSFSGVDPITFSEYSKARHEEVTKLQRSEGVSFTEDQINSMNIPASIMQKLITSRLIKFLAKELDLDFSDATIAEVIKKLPVFRDEDGLFDIEKFKTYLRMNYMTSEEYSENVHDYLAQTIILGSFIGNSHIPNARIDNIINFMAEKRIVDIATLPLTSDKVNVSDVKEEVLKNFYNENQDLFKSPWKRDICFLTIDQKAAKNHINITESDLLSFYEENKSEFEGKKFDNVKETIRSYLKKEKFDYWISGITKSLDDEVAGGSSLSEIASKHKLQIKCEKNISSENISAKAGGIFTPFLSDIFDMSEGEVSYPADLEDGGVVLFEISKYMPETLLEFNKVKNQVKKNYAIFSHRQEKIKLIQDFATKASPANFVRDSRSVNMRLNVQKSFTRSSLGEDTSFPSTMMNAIFTAKKDEIIGPFIEGDKAHIFILKTIGRDKDTISQMKKDKTSIISSIKEGMTEELLLYAGQRSKMEVKADLKSLSGSNSND